MNETLKNRIVGIIVITALAAIFIPMLFDEPITSTDSHSNDELLIPVQPSNQMAALIDSIPQSHEAIISKEKLTQLNLQQQKSTEPSTDKHLKSWVIQVGSFNSEKNANEFKGRLRQKKFNAYISPVKSKNGTKFRLFVGPELGHDIALKTQLRLEKIFNAKTLLISE